MHASRTAAIGAVASAALVASVAAGFAQSPSAQGKMRMIDVPPGAVVLVLPAGTAAPTDVAFPFPDMPSPVAMIRQMDQMMANMQRAFADPAAMGQVAGVVVTSFSNGHGTCTQRVTYGGNGAAPVVQVSSTGDGCAGAGMPAAAPPVQAPPHETPHLIEVRNQPRTAAPLIYAQAGE
jgi:hypothetical protein